MTFPVYVPDPTAPDPTTGAVATTGVFVDADANPQPLTGRQIALGVLGFLLGAAILGSILFFWWNSEPTPGANNQPAVTTSADNNTTARSTYRLPDASLKSEAPHLPVKSSSGIEYDRPKLGVLEGEVQGLAEAMATKVATAKSAADPNKPATLPVELNATIVFHNQFELVAYIDTLEYARVEFPRLLAGTPASIFDGVVNGWQKARHDSKPFEGTATYFAAKHPAIAADDSSDWVADSFGTTTGIAAATAALLLLASLIFVVVRRRRAATASATAASTPATVDPAIATS